MTRERRTRPPGRDASAPLFAELLKKTAYSWLAATREGFELAGGRKEPALRARLLHYSAARTLYQSRKPVCRSLDGSRSSSPPGKDCDSCPERRNCTPQICLELLVEVRVYRLLLAYTSARNFVEHLLQLERSGTDWRQVTHQLTAVSRGSWVEVRFAIPDDSG